MNGAYAAGDPTPAEPVRRGPAALRRRRAWGAGLMLAGAASMAASIGLFALSRGWSFLLFFAAFALMGIGWLMLAVLGWRHAVGATAALAVSYFALVAVEGPLRDASWRMLVWMNRDAMARAVEFLEPVRMTRYAARSDSICATLPGLPPANCQPLVAAMGEFRAHHAWKEGDVTFFMTYAWVDAHGGVFHCPRTCEPASTGPYPRYVTHVAGDWYRWAE